ncbi:hypothetical protein QOZ80_5AG0393860 [Eleusine coracana subsp. coracana]|nr:hypothetical protein QOZ80_5AG0393860 [Eleusine coracana subsp. coracana]
MGLLRRPPEERFINSHAAYMGYLLMGVKGLSFLLLTWSTVVLLGGFVSMLDKKDFWSVTMITLMQTAGVFDVFMKQKLSKIGYSYFALLGSKFYNGSHSVGSSRVPELVTTVAWILMLLGQLLALSIVLLPLAVLFSLGLYICTVIALWRLVQRDYHGGAAYSSDAANLKPALDVLYSLAEVQGSLFCYRTAYAFAGRGAAKKVIDKYKMTDLQAIDAVRDYLHETRSGCDKDPSFCKDRDLITYAVSLMVPGPPEGDSFCAGVSVLDAIIIAERWGRRRKEIEDLLLGSGQLSNIPHKLLCTLEQSTLTSTRAARIVKHIARRIHLDQYPSGIHRVVSLLPTSPQDCCCANTDDREMMQLGMGILVELATATDNCRIMSNTDGFLSRIVVPLGPVLNFSSSPYIASETMASGSLKLIARLIAVPGDTGIKMRREISSNRDLIYDMESIVDIDRVDCDSELRAAAATILRDLSMDILSWKIASESRGISIMVLLGTFFDDNIDKSTKISTGEKLATFSLQSASNAERILKANDDVVSNLAKILLNAENNECRVNAAEILAGLCVHCAGSEWGEMLRKAIIDLIPE